MRNKKEAQMPNKHRRKLSKGAQKAPATKVHGAQSRGGSRPKLEQGLEGAIPLTGITYTSSGAQAIIIYAWIVPKGNGKGRSPRKGR